MCGIAGILSFGSNSFPALRLKRMADMLVHRGPDDAGYVFFSKDGDIPQEFSDPEFSKRIHSKPVLNRESLGQISKDIVFAMTHRRLSILDLTAAGHQPMASPDGRYWITYNGEIYNFSELRNSLGAKGYKFRSRTDTEVVLAQWQEYGPEGLAELNGMFALAIFDRKTKELTLARDRAGIKPVYYSFSKEHLIFASEIKAILASGLIESRINSQSLVEYFTFQNIFSSETLFDKVFILESGTFLTVNAAGRFSKPKSYIRPTYDSSIHALEETDVCERLAGYFEKAVQRQLVADVEVGSYLSGGMDSGSIVAVAAQSIRRLLTFTVGFDLTNVSGLEQGFDERKPAERLSHLFQTEHYDVVLHSGDMPAAMERLTWHMDDPRVGMCHPNWYASKLASRFVKVCLAGSGGDELFGGYPWRYENMLKAASVEESDQICFKYWHRLLDPDEISHLFHPDLQAQKTKTWNSFQDIMSGAPVQQAGWSFQENLLQRILYFEYKTFLHGLLVTEDRMSMAHGLETRVPFLDNELMDFAWQIRPSLKFHSSSSTEMFKETSGKRILREAMSRYLPSDCTEQPKKGFSPPDGSWYRGPSMEYIKAILLDRRATARPWFDSIFIERKLQEHFDGLRNHRLLIWSLLSVELLQRHFLDAYSQPTKESSSDYAFQ